MVAILTRLARIMRFYNLFQDISEFMSSAKCILGFEGIVDKTPYAGGGRSRSLV